jgi:hypothetical protein
MPLNHLFLEKMSEGKKNSINLWFLIIENFEIQRGYG